MDLRLFALLKKDLKLLLADKRSLFINIMVPVALASFVGYLFAPHDKPASKIRVAVVDLDGSKTSKRLVKAIQNEETLKVRLLGLKKAKREIEEGDLVAAIVLPKGFSAKMGLKALFSKPKPTIELLTDPSRSLDAQVIKGALTKLVMQEVGRAFGHRKQGIADLKEAAQTVDQMSGTAEEKRLWKSFFNTGVRALRAQKQQTPAGEEGGGFQMPVTISSRDVLRKGGKFNSYSHSFAGMMVMYLLFVAIEGGAAVIDERRRGTWRRLRSAPVHGWELLFSKVLAVCLQAVFVALAVYFFGWLFFDVRVLGSVVGFCVMVLASAITAGGFALLLMGVGRTRSQVSGYGTFAVLLMSFLGGAWFPVFIMPPWLRTVSKAVPTRWMMDGLHATTWRGLDITAVGMPLLVLGGFSLAMGAVGLKAFRWEK